MCLCGEERITCKATTCVFKENGSKIIFIECEVLKVEAVDALEPRRPA